MSGMRESDDATGPPDGDLTIEQLAAAAGLPFTTIRLYQHRGLLAPPERRGRVGYYGPDHLARLRLIAQLQDRGYSLAAIKDLVDTWQTGHSLGELLGLGDRAPAEGAWVGELRLRPDQLATRFEGVELTAAAMARAHALGLLAFDGDVVVIPDPSFLEVGASLAAMGVPLDDVLDEYEHLRAVAGDLADRFASLFAQHLWQPFVDAGLPAAQVPALTAELARLGPLAEQIVTTTLRRAMTEAAGSFLDEQAAALATAPDTTRSSSTTG